jgi:ATP-dependent RNA helicase RhlE
MLNAGKTKKSKSPRVLILAPTRELAAQIHESILAYGKHLSLRSNIVYGGVKISRQIQRLQSIVDILVATPGRLLDLYQQGAVYLDNIEILVLDEADRMLDMGFIHAIKKIISKLPKKRQNLLFSATFSPEIRAFAKGFLINPHEINIAPQNTTAQSVEHKLHPVDKSRKAELLSYLIREKKWQKALVFSRTKHGANKLVQRLMQDKIQALAIHGNKSQAQRTNALSSFKEGKVQILVATDIASRGIDIEQLPQVVNFDLPNVPEDYVHRIGRTGRAGANGQAISLYSIDEVKQLNDVEKVLKKPINREIIAGFEPNLSPGLNSGEERASIKNRGFQNRGRRR